MIFENAYNQLTIMPVYNFRSVNDSRFLPFNDEQQCKSTFLSNALRYPIDDYFEGYSPDCPNNHNNKMKRYMVLVE
jgi:hypothetical protein